MDLAREYVRQVLYPDSVNFDRFNALTNFGAKPLTTAKIEFLIDEFEANKLDVKPDTYYPDGNMGIYFYSQDGGILYFSVNADDLAFKDMPK